jgi:hypothetical protein
MTPAHFGDKVVPEFCLSSERCEKDHPLIEDLQEFGKLSLLQIGKFAVSEVSM